uniref:Carboxylic ester hydrolase n=1 Tax=Nilaparvata lugens TaxID=108931 RepID=H9XQ29_NILLU|nr:carboxylesterase [Nilaparvata lugens]
MAVKWEMVGLAWAALLAFASFSAADNSVPVVHDTASGDLSGKFLTLTPNRTIEAYLGIPYAQPPIGSRRFKDPEPFGKWLGTFNGTKEPTKCLQVNGFLPGKPVEGSEDCLYLNVYTPSRNGVGCPVMVFIHGGGFVDGDGTSGFYGPDKLLLTKDIILVTIHYRLGFLGFASLDDGDFAGNYGLKDQSLALKWVKENIAKFGGDGDKVTVVGESAGAASAHFHILSPQSQGLFQRAILLSGTADCPWAVSTAHQNGNLTAKMASLVNCSADTSATELLECLRKVEGSEFLIHNEKFQTVWKGYSVPIVIFRPTIESHSGNAFITQESYKSQSKKPMMIGATSDEGALVLAILKRDKTRSLESALSEFDKRFTEIMPVEGDFLDDPDHKERAEKIKTEYFGNSTISNETLPQLTKLYSDTYFLNGIKSTLSRHEGEKYVYKFGYEGSYSISQLLSGDPTYRNGVCHADDLFYLFPMKPFLGLRVGSETEKDKEISAKFVDLITNFVIEGNPNSKSEPSIWTPSSKDVDFLSISTEGNFEMKKNFPGA